MAVDFLRSHAESQPDKPAVICGEEAIDFGALNRRASRVANVFTSLGCREGDRVAWMSFNSIAGAEIANGLRRAGLVIVPVNYRLRGAEIAYVLNDSRARVAAAGPDHVEALALIDGHRVTTTFMAPTLLQRLVDAQDRRPRDTSSLRALILGAAPCPFALKERAQAAFGQVLWEFYGATETGVNTVLRPEDQLRKPGSCGTAVPGQEIRLVLEDGSEAAPGQPGELMVRNSWQAEYFNRPDATRGSLRDGFFSVGDIAYRDEEGYYFICDRRVDMIISGGVNIYPAEVEAVLHAHPAVMDAAVIGVPDEEWGESVRAIVQLRPAMTATADELAAFCASRLAGYKKPRSYEFVDELPRDAAGKLLKRQLRDMRWRSAGRAI